MKHRGIATLAIAAIFAFLLLSQFDRQFFLLHIYESAIYVALFFLLIYEGEEWAYVLGIAAPAAWLLLISVTNLSGVMRQAGLVLRFQRPDDSANLVGAMAMLISLLMLGTCLYRWKQQRWGFQHAWRTIAVVSGTVAVYYGVLVVWFTHLVRASR